MEEKKDNTVEPTAAKPPTNGKAIAALVLGIASLVFLFIFLFISPILGIIGIVIGSQARRETAAAPETGRTMATAGFVCSIVGTALSVLFVIIAVIIGAAIVGSLAGGL